MGRKGHAPTNGPGNRLFLLGQGLCPDCREDLHPAGNSRLACPSCEATFPVGGGVP